MSEQLEQIGTPTNTDPEIRRWLPPFDVLVSAFALFGLAVVIRRRVREGH